MKQMVFWKKKLKIFCKFGRTPYPAQYFVRVYPPQKGKGEKKDLKNNDKYLHNTR